MRHSMHLGSRSGITTSCRRPRRRRNRRAPMARQTGQTRRAYLHAITHLARDTCAFEFRAVDGAALAPFTAGAHVDLILPNGIRRPYSLCNPQGETHRYVVGVKKASP